MKIKLCGKLAVEKPNFKEGLLLKRSIFTFSHFQKFFYRIHNLKGFFNLLIPKCHFPIFDIKNAYEYMTMHLDCVLFGKKYFRNYSEI